MYKIVASILAIFAIAMAYTPRDGNLRGADTNSENDPKPNLFSLGEVGNKSLFVQRWSGNWTDSKEYCESINMKLVSIETEEEKQFLASKYEYAVFWGWHWTAARDSHTATQFHWHYSEEDISTSLVLPWFPEIPDAISNNTFLTCGTYYIDEEFKGMSFHDCSKLNGHCICERVRQ